LFGLALDFGRLALLPPWGVVGSSLLDLGLQAFDSGDNGSGGYNGYDNGSYYAGGGEPYPPLCGRYYSDENPGCQQQF
jgi:hypothetical protein